MVQVLWKRLFLRGFGCYAGEKELVLREGLNVVIGPNEHGKSTLVAGLIAVLYGLPGSTDPAKFGKARYRSWSGAGVFTGQLEFAVDGELYRLRRDFDTDRISFARQQPEGWHELVRGEHRTLARKPNEPYLDLLRQLVGIPSAELFTATFCITQPLPDRHQLEAELVQLLSGAGSSYRQSLDQLSHALRLLTRYTGDRGVTERNGHNDSAWRNCGARRKPWVSRSRDTGSCSTPCLWHRRSWPGRGRSSRSWPAVSSRPSTPCGLGASGATTVCSMTRAGGSRPALRNSGNGLTGWPSRRRSCSRP